MVLASVRSNREYVTVHCTETTSLFRTEKVICSSSIRHHDHSQMRTEILGQAEVEVTFLTNHITRNMNQSQPLEHGPETISGYDHSIRSWIVEHPSRNVMATIMACCIKYLSMIASFKLFSTFKLTDTLWIFLGSCSRYQLYIPQRNTNRY